jgi:hypothetical protein
LAEEAEDLLPFSVLAGVGDRLLSFEEEQVLQAIVLAGHNSCAVAVALAV